MSLTSELSRPSSPVTRFIGLAAPLVASRNRQGPLRSAVDGLLGLAGCPRDVLVPPVTGADLGAVGTAFDYRVRYHLAPCRSDDLLARKGAALLARARPAAAPMLDWWFANLDELADALAPAGRHLADEEEELLARYCLVLAALEHVYRSRWMPALPSPMPKRSRVAEDPLLALADEGAVRDLVNLSRSAEVTFGPLVELVVSRAVAYHANPVFAGSRLIPADADFVIGDTLFELKTTKSLGPSVVRKALQQLVGYCLLDFDDRHRVRTVGVYFARQEWVCSWPLWILVFPPADVIRCARDGCEPSEPEVEGRLQKLRPLMEMVLRGGAIDLEKEFADS